MYKRLYSKKTKKGIVDIKQKPTNKPTNNMITYTKNLSEPWYTLIKMKIKTVEGRLNKGDFSNMKVGDCIIFKNNEFGFERQFKIKIKKITNYPNFQTYLEKEKLKHCLPGIDNMKDGINVYYRYYTKQDEIQYKIKAFTFE